MHSVVIHTWHVLHALWSVGSMYIQSRAIRTCTPKSYIHGMYYMPSGVWGLCTYTPGPYVHALRSHTYIPSGLWGHVYLQSRAIHGRSYMPSGVWGHINMPSRAIRTCNPKSYIHAIRGHTYMPSEVIHTYPSESDASTI